MVMVFQSSQIPTPPAPPGPIVVAPGSEAALQAQLVDLNVQLTGLRAERAGLRRQLESMLQTNPARPPVQAKDAEVGLKIANIEGQVATIQAQIASKQGGTPFIAIPPRLGNFRRETPTEVKMAFTLALVLLIPFSMAIARRIWRSGGPRTAPMAPDPEVATRLGRLEHAVDTIAIEIERISEGQRFMTKIMAERPSPQAVQPAAANDSADGQSLRALGAGPMEPIPVASRQGVRQSITPN
jgi:hypothetical protein